MSTQPFTPTGKTISIVANTTAPAGVQASANGTLQTNTYRVANPEANETIWYSMVPDSTQGGNAAGDAKTLAVIPTATSQFAMPLPAGGVEVVRGPYGAYFSGVTRTAAANLYVTPGDGI